MKYEMWMWVFLFLVKKYFFNWKWNKWIVEYLQWNINLVFDKLSLIIRNICFRISFSKMYHRNGRILIDSAEYDPGESRGWFDL